ncbi:short transient receptor potential channel 4-associated -like protein [Labeo rohita]|uniref:Short transient receptor potential channel 4-associated-like protein n=1 Tax=Labeo rohita TaxID=84645 RepID=A0A498MSN3_LABRO|nr:short transient receptor potential channel 4-associated -like protein [Labeo rohita]
MQLPVALLEERDKRAQWQGIPVLLRRLHESSHPNSDLSKIHSMVMELSSLLSMEAMSFVTEERKTPQESVSPNTYTFDLFGGVDLFVEILMRPTLTVQGDLPILSDDLIKDCLSVLYNCCICTEGVTKSLAAREDFVMFLFTLMSNKKVFLQTATLIEDILSVRKEIIQLEEIPNLASLVQSFNQQQLANFCRILSVTISEPDVGVDDKHTLLARSTQQKTSTCPSRAESNQVALLNIPGFIERLCKLATRKVTEATGASARLELEDWHSWLDNALVLDALMQLAIEEAEQSSTESSDESSLSSSPLRHRLPQSMKIVHEIMYKVEVLYVLCVMLMGRQRNQVHRMLAEFKLIPGLNNLFDKLIWRRQPSGHVLHRQNQNCDCSPEISFKIQFLRLLQSFSDHHENLVCDGKKGLLTRLISVMKKEPIDSSFRFWQARAVESFLRGTPSYADQVFLLRRGLLEHILYCIIDSGCKSHDVLQSYFDLLGELMKFNIDAFKRFNKYVNTEEKFQMFLTQINSSLVDSNMLVRCIVLSLDRFESQTKDMKVVEVFSECRLLSYMAQVENRLSFLFRLTSIINVQTLTQENVSCLNTSLVILMLARRRGKLPFYLSALREKEYAEKYPGCLLNNFHNLLRFWQHHYLNKDKDSTCLENSSCIPFTYWKETVSVLLGSGRSSHCAIATYIDEAYRDLDRDFLEL